ncbi:DUF6928 family protein [Streptomyces sp. NPDC048337]|uniref:DUF6928 family protein n=1 Tax=Streptomyces sp. NPDC048337 TaxID=3365535 RepID=UPI003715861F
MGAKTGLLVYADGDIPSALRQVTAAGIAETTELVGRLYPDWGLESTEGESLGEGTYPADGLTYAASFPGADIVCDRRLMIDRPSQLPDHLVAAGAGRRMVLHAMHSVVDWLTFAVWEDGRLIRSLSLSPDSGVIEDIGEPFPFEAPYWAGDHPVALDPDWGDEAPYPLPFHPLDLGEAALRAFFGFILEGRRAPDDIDADDLRLHGFRLTAPGGSAPAQRKADLEKVAQRMRGTTYHLAPKRHLEACCGTARGRTGAMKDDRAMTLGLPPAWGVQYSAYLPTEAAAGAVVAELAALRHRLIAVRAHDHFRSEPSSFWYGKPSMDPELEGWWQVFSLAVYSGHDRLALDPFLRGERILVAGIARSHGGFAQGGAEGHAVTLEQHFPRVGLLHERAAAEVPLPDPLPVEPVPPAAGPQWSCSGVGLPVEAVQAVVAVAERMYAGAADIPDVAEWLLDEDFAFGEPYDSTGEFLGDLADAVAHQGTCTDATVEAVPFLAALIRDAGVPAGTRVVLLGDLLRLAVTGRATAASLADRIAALGNVWEEPAADYMTRRAIAHEMPALLANWEVESDALRFVLAALTAAVTSDGDALVTRQRLATLPAPVGTSRADIMALVEALLRSDQPGLRTALDRLAAWLPDIAERSQSPYAASRDLALSVLPDLVIADVGPAAYR